MKIQLKGYPKQFDEINRILSDHSLAKPFSNYRTALLVIRGEQEICHFWIHVANIVGTILRSYSPRKSLEALTSLKTQSYKDKDTAYYAKHVASCISEMINHEVGTKGY